MASMNVRLDTNNVQTFYKAVDAYIDGVAKSGNRQALAGLYDFFMDNDHGSDIDKMLAAMDESKQMNLSENYKRLFKGRISSNDKKIMSEATMTDWDLMDQRRKWFKGSNRLAEEWLELFSDMPDSMPDEEFVQTANEWLASNGLRWQVTGKLDQNQEGEITWEIEG